MIPLKLTVRNFMCYRDGVPTLDFEGFHVACLCGDNGHGKTALLDSITWVLWGQARARTQEELVHQGRQDMSVDLEFMARDQRYRVGRRYSRSGRSRGATVLELQVSSGNGFRPITGNSVRETEAQIRDILHMDYDTFVNTAFLLQGRADTFTRSRPAERKQILAEVLDLSYYESLEGRAKGRSRDLQDKIRDADGFIALRQQELSRKPEHQAGLVAVDAALAGLAPRLDAVRRDVDRIRDTLTALKEWDVELQGLDSRVAERREQIADLEGRARHHQKGLDGYEALMARTAEIHERFTLLEAARGELERLDRASFSAADLERKRAGLDQEIAVQGQQLASRAEQLRLAIENELAPRAKGLPVIEERRRLLRAEQDGQDVLEATIGRGREQVRTRAAELRRLAQTLEQKHALDGKKAAQKREIAVKAERLSAQVQQVRGKIDGELEPRANLLPGIEEELRQNALAHEDLGRLAETLRERRGTLEQIEGRRRFLREAGDELMRQMGETRSKFDLLDHDGAECPLCDQPLGPEGQEHLRREFEQQGQERKRQYQANMDEQSGLDTSRHVLVDLVLRLEADHESKQREAQTAAAILGRGLEESRAAREELRPAIASLRQMEGQLEAKEFAREERKEVARLDARLAELDYDPERQDALQLEIDSENTRISRLETDLADTRQRTHSSAIALSAELKEARKASDELGPRRSELEGVDRTLASQDFAHAERASREDLAGRLARLGYDAESHRKAGEEVRELGPYADLSRRLLEAEDRFPQERAAMTAVQGTLARRRHDLDGDAARRAELARELDALSSVESEMDEARSVLEDMARRERDALAEQKYLRDRLATLAEVEGQVAWQEQHRGEMLDQKSVYDELAVAYGGNGIQALIIETAIPQLNDDANELLGRLTDHGLSLKLQLREGRRERRIGIRSEELEIMIGDEWGGTRSYETFSGGETFRINFALRVALSKLLARRSGAPLPILFIDEGFGSQDAGGQERLKEVIQSIQSDFEKIVVITHVEQVKEAFPTRIEVTKTPDGSTFVVV